MNEVNNMNVIALFFEAIKSPLRLMVRECHVLEESQEARLAEAKKEATKVTEE